MVTTKGNNEKCGNGSPSSQLAPEKQQNEIIIQSENTLLGNINLDKSNLEHFMSNGQLKEFLSRLESFTSKLEKDPTDIEFQGLMDSFLDYERLEKLTDSFLSRTEKLIPSQEERAHWFEFLENNLTKAIDKSKLLHEVSQSVSTGVDHCYLILNLSMFGWYVYKYHKARDANTGIALIMLGVSLWISRGPLVDAFTRAFPDMTSFFMKIIETHFRESKKEEPDENIQPQADIDSSLLTSCISAITSTIAISLGLSGKISSKTFLNAMKTAESAPDFLVKWMKAISEIWNRSIAETLGLDKLRFKISSDPFLEEYEKQVLQVIRDRSDGSLDLTLENLNYIVDLISEGETRYKNMPSDKNLQEVKRLLYDRVNDLRKIELEFRNSNIEQSGFRQEPVGILLRGGPGTQKSIILEHLAFAANAMSLSPENYDIFLRSPHTYTHNRQAEGKYWDGYTNKTNVLIFDDFGQTRDVAGNPDNEFMNVIRAINGFEMVMHVANMSQKGRLKMHAKWVIASTNLEKLTAKSIISSEALTRRFVLSYIVVPKPEYCQNPSDDLMKRKIDYDKLPRGLDGKEADPKPEHFLFYEVDEDGKHKIHHRVLNFTEVTERMKHEFERRKVWQQQHQKNFIETLNEIQPQGKELAETFVSCESYSDLSTIDLLKIVDDKPDEDDIFLRIRENYPDVDVDLFKTLYEREPALRLNAIIYMANNVTWLEDGRSFDLIWDMFLVYKQKPSILVDWMHGDFSKRITLVREHPKLEQVPFVERPSFSSMIKSMFSLARDFIANVEKALRMLFDSWIFKLVACSAIIWKLVSHYFGIKTEPQMHYHQPKGTQKTEQMSISQLRATIQSQAFDVQGKQILTTLMEKNVFPFKFLDINGDSHEIGSVTALGNGLVIVPRHYIDMLYSYQETIITSESKVYLEGKDGSIQAESTFFEFVDGCTDEGLSETHLVVAKFTKCRPIRDITKYFIDQEKFSRLPRIFPITAYIPSENMSICSDAFVRSFPIGNVTVIKGLEYKADTGVGDCGVPIVTRIPILGVQRIIGFHIAGNAKNSGLSAYAGVVTLQDLRTACMAVNHDLDENQVDGEIEVQGVPPHIFDKYTVLGTVKNVHSPYGLSKIVRTRLNNPIYYKSQERPAMLRVTGTIDPYEKALSKYCISSAVIDPELLNVARESYEEIWNAYPTNRKGLLSLEESIWGAPDSLDSIKSSTSSGVFMKYEDPHFKKRLFGEGVPRDSSNPEFLKIADVVKRISSDAALGKRHLWVFTDNLKDEGRSHEKVALGASRLFNGAPIMYLIVYRMYFGSFMYWYMENSLALGTAIQFNPYSNDWQTLAQRLSNFEPAGDPEVGAGDFSGFDGSEQPIVHNVILDMINAWYGDSDENQRIRKVLWLELTNSRHIYMNIVYEWFASLPSGHPMTIIVNCIYNHLAFRYCYYSLSHLTFKKPFNKHVSLFTCGDDNIFSVSSLMKEFFNELTLPEMMAAFGLKYTTESKGVAVQAFRKLSEVNFLKRKFRFEPLLGRYVAPLLIESVIEIPLWSKQGNVTEIFRTNLEVFMRELSLHSRHQFEDKKKKLIEGLRLLSPDMLEVADIHRSRTAYLAEVVNEYIEPRKVIPKTIPLL